MNTSNTHKKQFLKTLAVVAAALLAYHASAQGIRGFTPEQLEGINRPGYPVRPGGPANGQLPQPHVKQDITFPLTTKQATVATDGDIVTIKGEHQVQLTGDVLKQINAQDGNTAFKVTGNGIGVIQAGGQSYTVLALAWAQEQAHSRAVHQPWRNLELDLDELIREPANFIGRLYLLDADLTETSQDSEILGSKLEAKIAVKTKGKSVYVSNLERSQITQQESRLIMLVEIVENSEEWGLVCHKIIPALAYQQRSLRHTSGDGKLSLKTSHSEPIDLGLGDLLYLQLPQTRSSRTSYKADPNYFERLVYGNRMEHQYSALLRTVSSGQTDLEMSYQRMGINAGPEETISYRIKISKD